MSSPRVLSNLITEITAGGSRVVAGKSASGARQRRVRSGEFDPVSAAKSPKFGWCERSDSARDVIAPAALPVQPVVRAISPAVRDLVTGAFGASTRFAQRHREILTQRSVHEVQEAIDRMQSMTGLRPADYLDVLCTELRRDLTKE